MDSSKLKTKNIYNISEVTFLSEIIFCVHFSTDWENGIGAVHIARISNLNCYVVFKKHIGSIRLCGGKDKLSESISAKFLDFITSNVQPTYQCGIEYIF